MTVDAQVFFQVNAVTLTNRTTIFVAKPHINARERSLAAARVMAGDFDSSYGSRFVSLFSSLSGMARVG